MKPFMSQHKKDSVLTFLSLKQEAAGHLRLFSANLCSNVTSLSFRVRELYREEHSFCMIYYFPSHNGFINVQEAMASANKKVK